MSTKYFIYALFITIVCTACSWGRMLASSSDSGSGGSYRSGSSGGGSWGNGSGGGHK